jgi:hypothetical protein
MKSPLLWLLSLLVLAQLACSDPRCPAHLIQRGSYCHSCPDGSVARSGTCVTLDGGGEVSSPDDGSDSEDEEHPDASGFTIPNDAGLDAMVSNDAGIDAMVPKEAGLDADHTADAHPMESGSQAICYLDQDRDGVGGDVAIACDGPRGDAGAAMTSGDCDDSNPRRSPSLSDVCGDNVDNDCDGKIDDDASNACGGPCTTQLAHQPGEACNNSLLGACARTGSYLCQGSTTTVCSAPLGQSTPERCDDDIDNDCDGETDEGDAVEAITWYPDCDGDGFARKPGVRTCKKPDATPSCSAWLQAEPVTGSTEDCDDESIAYNPGITGFGLPPAGKSSSDLNCDGNAETAPYVAVKWNPFTTLRTAICDPSLDCVACATDCSVGATGVPACRGAQWLNNTSAPTATKPPCSITLADVYPFRLTFAETCAGTGGSAQWSSRSDGWQYCR